MRPADAIRRTPWGISLAAAALIFFDLLVVWPAWIGRTELRQELKQAQQDLAEQERLIATISTNRDTYAEKRSSVLEMESQLVPASEDTSLIRQVESLAGGRISVGEYRAEEMVYLSSNTAEKENRDQEEKEESAESGPYSRVSYELTASGGWNDLTTFLQGLETQVTGLRVEGVELANQGGTGNLTVVGSLYRVETPLPDLTGGESAAQN